MNIFVSGPVAWNLLIFLRELPRAQPHMTFAQRHRWTMGGTSAGKALNLARLGADVTLRTVIGEDDAGRAALDGLTGAGVRVLAEIDRGSPTEQHVNLMSEAGQRVSLYLTMPQLVPAVTSEVRSAIEAADVVVIDLAASARPLLSFARAAGRPIWVDLHDDDGVDEFRRPFRDAATVVFAASDRMTDPDGYLVEQIKAGKELAVCTHGADGASALDASGLELRVPAVPVDQVRDTNGAGDAFFSAFLTARLGGAGTAQCLSRAADWAAKCVRSDELSAPAPSP